MTDASTVAPVFSGLRVLVVEDNEVNQLVATKLLQKLGCVVTQAMNGEEALRQVAAAPFDMVFMDCQMPVMDGFAATAAIHALAEAGTIKAVPVVALTAHAMEKDRQKCLGAGMNDVLTKPVKKEDLLAMLKKWVAPKA